MRIHNPYAVEGNWYRGNLHTHSTNSDGGLPPQKVFEWYRSRGYHFLAMTDHSKCTDVSPFSDSSFVALTGEEMSHPHVVAINIPGTIKDDLDFDGQLRAINESGGIAVIAHPCWMGLLVEDLASREGYVGIEVFNFICQELNGKGSAVQIWDQLLQRGKRVWGFVNDDAHLTPKHPNAGKAWNMVKAKKLSRDALIEAMKAGAFYGSTGPEIHDIRVEEQTITVECSPAAVIRFVGDKWYGKVIEASFGTALTQASYRLRGQEQYIRIEVSDAHGNTAWSNPLFVDKG